MATQMLDRFAAALTACDRQQPGGLVGPSARRFAVYRNNVAVGLIRALESRFPAILGLVGEEFFRGMAREFALAQPPASPVLMEFGDLFPDFIADFPPAVDLAYLADIARIEIARTRAYHAGDQRRLGPEAFASIPASHLEALRIELHPAVQVVRSVHPAYTIFAMTIGLLPATAIEPWTPEDTLVDRSIYDVVVRRLPPGAAIFLTSLQAAMPLGEAAARAADAAPDFELAANLAEIIGSGMVTQLHLPEVTPS
jgi:hypothetical protein